MLRRIGTTNDRAIALTEALLGLARAGREGAAALVPIELGPVIAEAVDDERADAAASGIRIDTSLRPAPVLGDRTLLARLSANLVRNAVVHNTEGGWVSVETGRGDRRSVLVVENSGALVDPAVAATLTEPFVRAAGRARSAGGPEGSGLGLAIVASVARAHRATVDVVARPDGGLRVSVEFPDGPPHA